MAFEKEYNPYEKQRINLSHLAISVVESDMIAFGNSKPNNFLNRIIRNFKEDADASIHFALEKERFRLKEILGTTDIESERIDKLIAKKEEELKNQAKSHPKHESMLIAVSKDTQKFLKDKKLCFEDKYYDSIGLYLKSIIEEYASKPFSERELIYFNDKVEVINSGIVDKKKGEYIALALSYSDGRCYTVIPYDIKKDPMGMYNYLVGFSVDSEKNPKKPVSIRISGNFEIKLKKSEKYKLSASYKNKMEDCIKTKGVQFLIGEDTEIVVYLTEAGKKRFSNQLHLRPQYTKIRDDGGYVFNCTPKQAEIYFIRFGKDAYIKEPESLRKEMLKYYRDAYNRYND